MDLLFAFRSLRRAPAYAVMMVMTLALGIGANTAIFNVAWQVLLKPLPFPAEDRLVMLWEGFGPERQINPPRPQSFSIGSVTVAGSTRWPPLTSINRR